MLFAVLAACAEEIYTSKSYFVDDGVYTIAISPDGSRVAFATESGKTRIVDTATGQDAGAIDWPEVSIHSMRFSADGTKLALVSQAEGISIRDVASGREVAAVKPEVPAYVANFSADGARLAAASQSARVYDLSTGKEIAAFAGGESSVIEVSFSADGTRLAAISNDKTVRIFDLASGTEVLSLPHQENPNVAVFSPDGHKIATGGGDGIVRIFDANTGKELAQLKGHEATVFDVRFNVDGSRIISGSGDRSVRIWDVAKGETLAVLPGHSYEVYSAAFSSDGSRVYSISGGIARIWTRLEPAQLLQSAAGVWRKSYGDDAQLPPDFVRTVCVEAPIVVRENGAVIFFQVRAEGEPQAEQHFRCANDLKCQVFQGLSAQGAEPIGEVTLSFEGEKGKMCWPQGCEDILRCPVIEWTEAERASGLAKAWEDTVTKNAE
jgi:Tol biopolymer transport system component